MSKNIQQVFATNPITANTATDLMYFGQSPYAINNDAAMTYANFSAQFGAPYTPSALTANSDANVTIMLGGNPITALLNATSITMGWSGQLSPDRGGTGTNNGTNTFTIGGNFQMSGGFTFNGILTGNTSVTFPTSGTLATTSQIPSGTAFTAGSDLNVTLSLGGNPATALVNPASITAGWIGELSGIRGGTGVNNGINTATFAGSLNFADSFTTIGSFSVTQNYTAPTNVTFPTTGTLATTSQLPNPSALTANNDTNVLLTLAGSPSTALLQATSITAGWSGVLSGVRGGTGVNNGASTITVGGNFQMSGGFTFNGTLVGNTAVTFPTSGTLATTAQIPTGTPFTANNDTNITLTLAGNPATALINPTSVTAGWLGTLSTARGGLGTGVTPTNGQVPIGNGTGYVPNNIIGGTGIGVLNGPGTITLSATGATINWFDQTSNTVTMIANAGYTINNGLTLVTLTLPSTANQGDFVEINGFSLGSWIIAQATGQTIFFGNLFTTTGTGGTLAPQSPRNCIRLRAAQTGTATTWIVVSSSGSFNLV